jgi:hypothetical protein
MTGTIETTEEIEETGALQGSRTHIETLTETIEMGAGMTEIMGQERRSQETEDGSLKGHTTGEEVEKNRKWR